MTYSTDLEARIDKLTADWALGKKKMFGGLGYFIDGMMCFALRGDELLLRPGAEQSDVVMQRPGVHIAVMGQRVMKNWLQAGGESISSDERLLELLIIGRDYALTLPPKP